MGSKVVLRSTFRIQNSVMAVSNTVGEFLFVIVLGSWRNTGYFTYCTLSISCMYFNAREVFQSLC